MTVHRHAFDRDAATFHALLAGAARPARDADDAFVGHVFACVLAIGLEEVVREGASLAAATGLAPAEIDEILADRFPRFDRRPVPASEARSPEIEEEILRDLLVAHLAPERANAEGRRVAAMVARRAMLPDHLWQDLGLRERSELSRLLALFFPVLHAGNTKNMRWKKYFYRRLCEAEGFALCTAPSCAVCADFGDCFGAEDGESRMAERRRAMDLAIAAPLAAE